MRSILLILLWVFIGLSTNALAQSPGIRSRTTTLFEEFKPGIVTLDSGNRSHQKQLNIFMKNSTLVFNQAGTIMEAIMSTIKSVEIEGRTFVNYNDCLYEIVAADTVDDVQLVNTQLIDMDAWHAEALNSSVVDNLDFSSNSRALTVTRRENSTTETYPVIKSYYFYHQGKMIPADIRSIRSVLSKKKRQEFDQITFYDFRWGDPSSLVRLMPLFK